MIEELKIKGKIYNLPIFLPDATQGVVRGLSSTDLNMVGTRGVVVNTYHLMETPGSELLAKVEGIKNFMNFDGLVVSDSGGWQIFSLIHRSNRPGQITDEGVQFSLAGRRTEIFTPEDSIRRQLSLQSDIVICLDDFTAPEASEERVEESVRRTTLWAKRCREEFDRLTKNEKSPPLLFACIHGGLSKKARQRSAEELLSIGFDGYGYGGYMVEDGRGLNLEMMGYLAELIPNQYPKFALGVGTPWDIAACFKLGWDIFDCTLPTRDARHHRLYTFMDAPDKLDLAKKESYQFVYINRGKYGEDLRPISDYCHCELCTNYSRAYLHHLFEIKDYSALRLATIHNLTLYNRLIDSLSVHKNDSQI